MIFKINTKNKIILWTFFAIFLVVGFGLGKVEKASAADNCSCVTNATNDAISAMNAGAGGVVTNQRLYSTEKSDQSSCQSYCKDKGYDMYEFDSEVYNYNSATGKTEDLGKLTNGSVDSNYNNGGDNDICTGLSFFSPTTWINCLLVHVLRFEGLLISAAATLFVKIIDTSVFETILSGNSVIYEMWGFVRDILNVAFILVLLFSAFCTVFQIQKYSYKNLLVTLIIMALLVNFSFPIARVIIDFGNVLMYYFINGMGLSDVSKIFANFGENSAIGKIIGAKYSVDTASTAYLICAVIFIFVFAVTLIIIALLLLIRIVALAILVIFASVAFVGSIVPFLSKYASDWWEAIFKYSFFGPLMVFMLVIATKMMDKITGLQSGFKEVAKGQGGSTDASIIGTMAFFLIPTVILWVGISAAQKMSIAGAGAIVGRGQKFMNWVGRGALNTGKWATYKGAWWGVKQTGIPGGMKIKYDEWKKQGSLGSDAREGREARFAGGKAEAAYDAKKRKELRDKWKDAGGASDRDIDDNLRSKDKYKRQAAAMEAAENKGFRDLAQYQEAKKAAATDPVIQKAFEQKVKEKYIKFEMDDNIHNKKAEETARLGRALSAAEEQTIEENEYKDKLGKMSFEQLAKQQKLHENIGTDFQLQRHIHDMARRSPTQHQKFFEKLSADQQTAYDSAGFAP